MSNSNKFQIVRIKWVDSHHNQDGWLMRHEYIEWRDDDATIESVGFLLEKTDEWYVISMSVGCGSVADCMKIPKSVVREFDILGTREIDKFDYSFFKSNEK